MAKLGRPKKTDLEKRKMHGDRGQEHVIPGDSRDNTETHIQNERPSRAAQYQLERSKRTHEESIQAMKAGNQGLLAVPQDLVAYLNKNDMHGCWKVIGKDKSLDVFLEMGYVPVRDSSGTPITRTIGRSTQSEERQMLLAIKNDLYNALMDIQRESTRLRTQQTVSTMDEPRVKVKEVSAQDGFDIDEMISNFANQ